MATELDYVKPTSDCPHPEWWSAPDAMASEYELGDFLYGLIRILKPQVALETGAYHGDTTVRMAQAIKDNGIGVLHTCEIDPEYILFAEARVSPFGDCVRLHRMHSGELIKGIRGIDFAFIDGGPEREYECPLLNLSPHAIVAIHDSRYHCYPRPWAEQSPRDWDGADPRPLAEQMDWAELFIPTPRGLSLFKQSKYAQCERK